MRLAVILDPSEQGDLEVTFPDLQGLFNQQLCIARLQMLDLVQQRHEFAVSGAMRWPFSQEAPLYARAFVDFYPRY